MRFRLLHASPSEVTFLIFFSFVYRPAAHAPRHPLPAPNGRPSSAPPLLLTRARARACPAPSRTSTPAAVFKRIADFPTLSVLVLLPLLIILSTFLFLLPPAGTRALCLCLAHFLSLTAFRDLALSDEMKAPFSLSACAVLAACLSLANAHGTVICSLRGKSFANHQLKLAL